MLFLFLFILVTCAVNCDDSSNYRVIRDEDYEPESRKFSVYWNVPTIQCQAKNIPFKNLYRKFGIIQNKHDSFLGNEISILYDPGLFPALLKNRDGDVKYRNGGVPQEGNLDQHLDAFSAAVESNIPDQNFKGLAVIDFEAWRPIFRQNSGTLAQYQEVSIGLEESGDYEEAKTKFEAAAREFMRSTLIAAKEMRPDAVWGYYGFPHCFNMVPSHMQQSCANGVKEENDRLKWMWSRSDALYPSVYPSKKFSLHQVAELVRGRVHEAKRVAAPGTAIIPYFWFKYTDGGFLSPEAVKTSMKALHDSKVSGVIIWGSSADVNTVEKCEALKEYVREVLGPAVAKYTKNTDEWSEDDPYVSSV